MAIEKIGGFVPNLHDKINKSNNGNFGTIIKDLIGNTVQSQNDANKITDDFIQGKDVELHDVMIAGQKAKTNLELLMQIRNKAIDMYKELTRMS